jgi:anti-anti-sigma factor
VQPERERVRVCLVGELDMDTAPVAREAVAELIAVGFTSIVIDFSGLEFMDTSGLHLAEDLAGREGVTWAFIPGSPAVQRLFKLARLESELPFVRPLFASSPGIGAPGNAGSPRYGRPGQHARRSRPAPSRRRR